MEKRTAKSLGVIVLIAALLLSTFVVVAHSLTPSRAIPALVSTEWLAGNINLPGLVILDVRSAEAYGAGHIPGAVNVPEAEWYVNDPGAVPLTTPWMEFPSSEELFDLVGGAGIKPDSIVVVVGAAGHPYFLAGAARVAVTLLYAGVKNVAVLDGGHDKWVNEGRSISTVPVTPTPVAYTGVLDAAMVVSKSYVLGKVQAMDHGLKRLFVRTAIIDCRDADVYFGVTIEPWGPAGHIPHARSLPAPWVWTADWTYKDLSVLEAMALGVVGWDKGKEVIIYCGVGGYASVWLFLLREALGYRNAKMYDGSWQEWALAPAGPISVYTWG